jgi:hypothetical protein
MQTVRVFKYIDQLDAFVVTDEYRHLAEQLGLSEWNPVVWIGRLFTLDNDYGEHGFDNWDEREALEEDGPDVREARSNRTRPRASTHHTGVATSGSSSSS